MVAVAAGHGLAVLAGDVFRRHAVGLEVREEKARRLVQALAHRVEVDAQKRRLTGRAEQKRLGSRIHLDDLGYGLADEVLGATERRVHVVDDEHGGLFVIEQVGKRVAHALDGSEEQRVDVGHEVVLQPHEAVKLVASLAIEGG